MKKINYLVLMAAMLLICTNVWATTRTAGNASQFESAWKAAQDGDVIQLTNDIAITKILWLGTETMNGTSKSITLDLNGWVLTNSDNTLKYMFFLTHGELNVITSVPGGQIIQNGSKNEELFRITGSTYKNLDPKTAESGYFTHLTIGEGVTVDAQVKNTIVIDQLGAWPLTATNAWGTAGTTVPTSLPYKTTVYKGGYGVANGVRIDVHGTIRGEKYAFKSNGNLGSPSMDAAADLTGYWEDPAQTIPYTKKDGDVNYSPFIRLYSTADLRVPASNEASKKPVAVYCSGYARWLIEGTCVGSTAVYVKSGDVDIHDATIQSNYTGDYVAASATNSGVTASGSAIVIESNNAYAGDIDVTVSGDSHVTATNGYAVDEAVTSATETKVDAITINGGTFEGGTVPDPEDPEKTTQGTIKITGETVNNEETTVTITGGEVNGAGENNVNIGGQDLATYLSDQGETTHITTVDDGAGHVTVVITEGAAPSGQESVISAGDGSSVKWAHADPYDDDPMTETLTADKTLDELEINESYNQTLTVSSGVTLSAGRVVLGTKAKIIVEAGGSFIVTGEQGITANSANNIILKTSSSAQAIFLVNPSVNANKHPKAQVELYSKAYRVGDHVVWQRFGVPSFEEQITRSQIAYDNVTYPSVFRKLVNDEWVSVPADEKLMPFTTYAVNTSSETAGAVYTFTCNLVGNTNASLKVASKWNYFANSYTAPISVKQLISDLGSKYTNVSGTIYLHDSESDDWYIINSGSQYTHPEYPKVIHPMNAFILQKMSAGSNPVVDYEDHVYDPTLNPALLTPARQGKAPFAMAVVEIVAADGTKDEVSLLEGEQFSAEFDNSYDAAKLMNKEQTYIFADGMNDKLGAIATDNLEGTTLSIAAKEQTSFIMTVRNANGMNYAVRDVLTGTEVELTEGATYMFTVPANTNVDGRFQIVGVHKVPTAIDNVEEVAATKGIYNMAGQYMGNDFHSLSAGVYVVDGKKVVK
jgi:hypothetical protein